MAPDCNGLHGCVLKLPSNVIAIPGDLNPLVRNELDADRQFFKNRPPRDYQLRRTFPNEISAFCLWMGTSPPPAGKALSTLVRRRPGILMRGYIVAQQGLETNVSEKAVRAIYKYLSGLSTDQEVCRLNDWSNGSP